MRGARAVAVGTLVVATSAGAAVTAGYVLDGTGRPALGAWATVWGTATLLVTGGLALAFSSRRRAPRRAGHAIIGLTLGAIAYFTLWWAISTGTPLMTLEGAWMWPLGVVTLAGSIWSLRRAVVARS